MAVLKFLFVILLCIPVAYVAFRLVVNIADRIIDGSKGTRKG